MKQGKSGAQRKGSGAEYLLLAEARRGLAAPGATPRGPRLARAS